MAKRSVSQLLLGLAFAAGLLSACSGSQQFTRYVSVRSAAVWAPSMNADLVLAVRPAGEVEMYSWLGTGARVGRSGATYRLVRRVGGTYAGAPRVAVSAVWRIADPKMRPQFENSRRALFNLRRQHLSGFHMDLLLEDVRQPGRYLIIGFYGGKEDLNLARSHPVIAEFSRSNPPAGFGATEERTLLYYDVLSSNLR